MAVVGEVGVELFMFFFFKQKPAYELRISDWSSDVCSSDLMAARAAQELQDGFYVNLGIGLPTMVANFIPDGMDVWLQSENGLMGIGPFPRDDEVDADIINAGKQTVNELPGSAYFSSTDSFTMISGVHITLSILRPMQV